MTEKTLPVRGKVSFEEMKRVNDHGAEYWSARDLQPLLGYSQWRRFEDAVQRWRSGSRTCKLYASGV